MLLIGFGNTFSCCLDYVKFSSRESGSHMEDIVVVSHKIIRFAHVLDHKSYGLISDT